MALSLLPQEAGKESKIAAGKGAMPPLALGYARNPAPSKDRPNLLCRHPQPVHPAGPNQEKPLPKPHVWLQGKNQGQPRRDQFAPLNQ
jgi:hypothetical protein